MIENVRSVHFSGICGTAMASCAAALKARGLQVTGSDQGVYPPMSTFLEAQNIAIQSPYAESNLAHGPDLTVIGNALSRGNPEVELVLERKMRYTSLPELLKEVFIRGKRCIVVSGTHGKTTTASLMAWIFEAAGRNPSFLIGGVPHNFGLGARFTDSDWIIMEGDEYDTAFFDKRSKFLHYLPEVGIVNNLEFDHADIFDSMDAIKLSFQRFINLIPRNGLLLANGDETELQEMLETPHCPVKTFGLGKVNQLRATEITPYDRGTSFRLDGFDYRVPLIGTFNLRNTMAVVACARHCGIDPETLNQGLSSFQGIRRRMEIRAEVDDIMILDDFGHHPTAIRETIDGLRSAWPGRRLWAVFEPRSNTTRRNIFQDELAQALGAADCVLFSRIDRVDQLPVSEQLNPEKLVQDICSQGKHCEYMKTADAIRDHLAARTEPQDIVCIFSNGSFDGLHGKLEQALQERERSRN